MRARLVKVEPAGDVRLAPAASLTRRLCTRLARSWAKRRGPLQDALLKHNLATRANSFWLGLRRKRGECINRVRLPGDGTGPEVVREGLKVMDAAGKKFDLNMKSRP